MVSETFRSEELVCLSGMEMRQGLLQRRFSAVELVQAHLRRIKETNEQYNSFITICEEQGLEAARGADLVLREKGESAPPLTGVPVAVKDMIVTQGVETTCASKILRGFLPPYDATAVARLRRSGAVIIGKTNMDEFAMGSSNEYSAFGPARNPWDAERVPGGSSGGSAVAVAAGQAPFSLGTDTGGSIRQPAALTGIFGMKPTYGRVSRYGSVGYASSLDQIGPFARTVEDLAVLLATISGRDERDATSMEAPVPDYLSELRAAAGADLKGIRIGVPRELPREGVEPQVMAAFEQALRTLAELGAAIVEVSLAHSEYSLSTYYIIVMAEASSNLARYDGVRYGRRASDIDSLAELYERTRAEGFGAEVKRRIMMGSYVLSAGYYDAYYRKAQQVRTLIINDFKAAFANHCDLIATPTSPTTAFKLGEKTSSPLTMYAADIFTVPVNLAGLPALSIPGGLSNSGLPIGLQLIGPPFSESRLLQAADAFFRRSPTDGFLDINRPEL